MKNLLRAIQVAMILLLSSQATHAQVNTEKMRSSKLDEGWSGFAKFGFGYREGNSNLFKLNANLRVDYSVNRLHSFLVGNLERTEESDRESAAYKGFLHFRNMYAIIKKLDAEVFLQKEFNDFIRLENRDLIGAGLRFNFQLEDQKLSYHIGLGLMWEHENYDSSDEDDANISRSTNYLSLNWHPSEHLAVICIEYLQVDVENSSDFRFLSDMVVGYNLTKKLIFETNFKYRFDNEPVSGIKKYDLDIKNGIRFNF